MIRRFTFAALATIVPAFLVLAPPDAYAGIESCGKINVSGSSTCTVEVEGGCTAKCTPVNFEAACTVEPATITAQCDGTCAATAEASCTGSCNGTCKADCEANPGSFNCEGSCTGSCNADCAGQCAGNASGNTASGSCEAKCQANCSAKCSAKCTGTPPSATCEGKCQASCSGSCEAKVNAKCNIDCRAKVDQGKVDCQARLQGGCTARCQQPEGALFCDNQYVDHGGNLQDCIDSLRATFNIQVTGSASAQCSGNQCTAEAEGSASCAAAPSSAPILPELALMTMVGLAIARRARRGRR